MLPHCTILRAELLMEDLQPTHRTPFQCTPPPRWHMPMPAPTLQSSMISGARYHRDITYCVKPLERGRLIGLAASRLSFLFGRQCSVPCECTSICARGAYMCCTCWTRLGHADLASESLPQEMPQFTRCIHAACTPIVSTESFQLRAGTDFKNPTPFPISPCAHATTNSNTSVTHAVDTSEKRGAPTPTSERPHPRHPQQGP
jgi:hypothetical protein